MPIKFTPTGQLDIATDPAQLPEQSDGKTAVSGAMTRCRNLRLDEQGKAVTRWGVSKVSETAVPDTHKVFELSGDRYEFAPGDIYKNETALGLTLTGTGLWSAVVSRAYNETDPRLFATNGTDKITLLDGVRGEWGLDAPVLSDPAESSDYACTYAWEQDDYGPSTVLVTQANELTGKVFFCQWEGDFLDGDDAGASATDLQEYHATAPFEADEAGLGDVTHYVRVTYKRKDGTTLITESNPSAAMPCRGGVSFPYWEASADTTVTHVGIYRTLDATEDGDAYFVADVEIAQGSEVFWVPDESLGELCALDHDRPPLGITVLGGPTFQGVIFGSVGDLLYYSKANQPEYWPLLNYVEVGAPQWPITALEVVSGAVYALTRRELYQIQGTGPESFFPLPMRVKTGALSDAGTMAVHGVGVFHVGYDGLYLYSSQGDAELTGPRFRPAFRGETVETLPAASTGGLESAWLQTYKGKLFFGYPSEGSQYPNAVLVLDMDTQRVSHYDYGLTLRCVCEDVTNDRILAVDTSGYVWWLENKHASRGAVEWEVQSKIYNLLRRFFPRAARYDVTVDAGGTANGEIVLDDTVRQTHPITARTTKRRLVTGCNGERMAIRLTGTGPVTVRSVEVE